MPEFSAKDYVVPGISAASSILGGIIARGQAKRDFQQGRKLFEQDREYNSPKNQLARIHEAGLPSAAYFGGSASSQSDVFSGNIAETGNGIAEAGDRISKYVSHRLERIQVEAAEQNLAILTNQRKISDVETQDALSEVEDPEFKMTFTDEPSPEPQQIPKVPRVISNKRQASRIENAKEQALNLQNGLLSLQKELKAATNDNEIKLVQEKLNNLIQDTLGKGEDVKTKGIENTYLESELKYKQTIRDLRQAFWGKLRTGDMPNFREILNILMLALENRLN